jgi:hypothetical protein
MQLSCNSVAVLACLGALVGCSGGNPSTGDAGADAGPGTCTPAGAGLAGFCPPADPGPRGILFTASGEALALSGYPFPPANAGDTAFVDGWDVKFAHLIVTVDALKLSGNPDLSPGDESLTGPLVAEADGPWAIDLAHSDPSYLQGKAGGGEEAVPIAALSNENEAGGAGFATDGTRYAFGYDLLAAATQVEGRATMNVNLDAGALADYQEMVQQQCVVFYDGVATFRGTLADPTCNDNPIYATWPKTVSFRLCFRTPTTYINCQNPDNDPAAPLANEEHERGIAFVNNGSVVAQVTVHTDHPFWDSVLHDAPLHFDQFAARVAGQADAGTPTVTLGMTAGVDYTSYQDALGNLLPWRYCIPPPTDVHAQLTGVMSFDPQTVPHATSDTAPATGLRDYADFSSYDQSTQGHLNSDGLCYVKRNYPSPR